MRAADADPVGTHFMGSHIIGRWTLKSTTMCVNAVVNETAGGGMQPIGECIDILRWLHAGEISPEEGDLICDAMIEEDSCIPYYQRLCLVKVELTAYLADVPLCELADWRYNGWPNTCVTCQRPIDIAADRWLIRTDKTPSYMIHVECGPLSLSDIFTR